LKLAGFDLYVSSSHLEGLGTAILDAMLAGLPVAAAAVGGVTDVVIDGETGRLAPARDPAALAEAVIAALEDPEGSRRMADNARRRVAERFSAAAMAEGTLAVYRKLLSQTFP
jgi:glycosyltransferase involved in cell wall biosynthesis